MCQFGDMPVVGCASWGMVQFGDLWIGGCGVKIPFIALDDP